MPPRRRKPSGLTDEDVARLRTQVGEGRRPRVSLSGPQFEDSAAGTVVRIGDPAVDGADFLTVRVKVNGVTDELAFAPTELNLGGRTKAAAAPQPGTARVRAPRATKPVASVSGLAAAPPSPPPAAASEAADRAARPATNGAAQPAASGVPAPAASGVPAPAGPPPTTSPAAGRRRKTPAAATVSVTISSSGAAWSVSASRGARTIVRGVPVTPGLVTAIADLLDQPAVSEAVAEINETALQQARQRAEQLRSELNDLEAVLATHRAPR
jgi:hypothetical protein